MNAYGFLNKIADLACCLSCSNYCKLLQLQQAHADPHNLPAAKHSQYNLRHLDLRQLQAFCETSPITFLTELVSSTLQLPYYYCYYYASVNVLLPNTTDFVSSFWSYEFARGFLKRALKVGVLALSAYK